MRNGLVRCVIVTGDPGLPKCLEFTPLWMHPRLAVGRCSPAPDCWAVAEQMLGNLEWRTLSNFLSRGVGLEVVCTYYQEDTWHKCGTGSLWQQLLDVLEPAQLHFDCDCAAEMLLCRCWHPAPGVAFCLVVQ